MKLLYAENSNRPFRNNMPSGSFNFGMSMTDDSAAVNTDAIWLAVSVAVLAIGLLIAKIYKKY